MNIDKLKAAAEASVKADRNWYTFVVLTNPPADIDEEAATFIAAADPTTILDLIEVLHESNESNAKLADIVVARDTRLKAAEELIAVQHKALEAGHLYIVDAGYPALQRQELKKLAFVSSTELAGHLARTLAKHAAYREEYPADE